MVKNNMYVGVDVHKRSFTITIMKDGQLLKPCKVPSDTQALVKLLKKRAGKQHVTMAYEAGPCGFSLYDTAKENAIDCIVVHPLSLRKAYNEHIKTDAIDSRKLVVDLKAQQLNGIRVPIMCYRQLRHFTKQREHYAREVRAIKQRIKSLLLYAGEQDLLFNIDDRHWSQAYLEKLAAHSVDYAVRIRLDSMLSDLEHMNSQDRSIQKQALKFCNSHEELQKHMQLLQTIPGIGPKTALAILGRIGDPVDMRSQNELAAFFGLHPRERSSGESVYKGSITENGSRYARSLLVEAAWTAIRKDTELRQFFDRIRSKNNPRYGSMKAIVAVARKLTKRIHRVLKDQRPYRID